MSAAGALPEGFLRSAERFPGRTALVVGRTAFSYEELLGRAGAIAAAITSRAAASPHRLVGVFAHRSVTAYAGVLGALLSGNGYVPLNRTFPHRRTKSMFERSGVRALVVDADSVDQLGLIIGDSHTALLVLCPDVDDVGRLRQRFTQHVILGGQDLRPEPFRTTTPASTDDLAYLLFTSGSTGQPKAVMVTQENVRHYVQTMASRYTVREDDRCSQMFDLTFDLSAHDMFVSWEGGAALHVPDDKEVIKPGKFISDAALTMWFSVPSTAVYMRRFGMLKPGRFPTLRWSLFCGEALPADVAEAFAAAAPNSTVENLYGPTEATIACTAYRLEFGSSRAGPHGVTPIGAPLPGMEALVVDESLAAVPEGETGELLVAGPQVSRGYLDDASRTSAAFVVPPGKNNTHYRTGDRVVMQDGLLQYLGRVDHQVKVNGYRVELGEVEAAMRELSGHDAVVALPWPVTGAGTASGIVAFVAASTDAVQTGPLKRALAERLPSYAVPRDIHVLPELPLNANGKFDRSALTARLNEKP